MNKNCIDCRYPVKPPTKKCACFTKVSYPLIDIVEFQYNDNGTSFCSGFKSKRKG